jgi:hypothetical protein
VESYYLGASRELHAYLSWFVTAQDDGWKIQLQQILTVENCSLRGFMTIFSFEMTHQARRQKN